MSYQLGFFLGVSIVFFYSLSVLNFFVKYINKKYRSKINSNKKLKSVFNPFMKFIVKYHKLFGVLTAVALIAHFTVQYSLFGLNLTGALAGITLVLQVILGGYIYKKKKRKGIAFQSHRLVAILLLILMAIHIF
jgi:hypothetical protein